MEPYDVIRLLGCARVPYTDESRTTEGPLDPQHPTHHILADSTAAHPSRDERPFAFPDVPLRSTSPHLPSRAGTG